jgi:hypothetical protein
MSMVRARAMLLICLGLFGLVGWVNWPGEEITLPTIRSCVDDVQYFAPGPDFPLADEEAALDEHVAASEQ